MPEDCLFRSGEPSKDKRQVPIRPGYFIKVNEIGICSNPPKPFCLIAIATGATLPFCVYPEASIINCPIAKETSKDLTDKLKALK